MNQSLEPSQMVTLAGTLKSASGNSSQLPAQAYLRFQMTETITGAFSMKDVNEVVVVPASQLTPMFNMPACIPGLLTRRSRIMWTVDLADLLLGEPLIRAPLGASSKGQFKAQPSRGAGTTSPQAGKYNIVIVRVNSKVLLGLIVQQIRGYIQIAEEAILPAQKGAVAEKISPALLPYVSGCVPANDDSEEADLLLLEVSAIAQRLQHEAADMAYQSA